MPFARRRYGRCNLNDVHTKLCISLYLDTRRDLIEYAVFLELRRVLCGFCLTAKEYRKH